MWWHRTVLLVGLFIIGIGTCLWFKNPDSHLIPIYFGVAGLVVSFLPLPFSIVSAKSQTSHKTWGAKLIVVADAARRGQEVKLLPSEYGHDLTRDRHWAVQVKRVVEITVRRRRCFGVEFRDLDPIEYMVWVSGVDPTPVDLHSGQVQIINLPQPRLGNVQWPPFKS